ncbi:MAG: GNAT family N-acetyltransferase [Balneolaceae bacterium]|nr:GNAT family N-acetyltransferase [Balneolaceae bacterium]
MLIRPVQHNDLSTIRQLNEQAVPHVNSIPISDFEEFMEMSSFFLVVEIEQKVVAYLIVLGPGQSYDSENYRYFSEHYPSFDYVDRIVVSPEYHGKKIGSKLYAYLVEHSKEQRITCEVNIDPPNPGSTIFHTKLGFKEVGQQLSEGGKKTVSLMVKELSTK